MTVNRKTNGTYCQKLRVDLGLSQEGLATKLGFDGPGLRSIIEIESGRGGSVNHLMQLAKFYELPDWKSLADPKSQATPGPPDRGKCALHAYTGRWNLKVNFVRWRNHDLQKGESVTAEGLLDLFISADGQDGVGTAHGKLHLELLPHDAGQLPYNGSIVVVDRVNQVCCNSEGGLTFMSETFARHAIPGHGDPPGRLPVGHDIPGPTTFEWKLHKSSTSDKLEGEYGVPADIRDRAHVVIWRYP